MVQNSAQAGLQLCCTAPGWVQEAPSLAQEAPSWAQEASKILQDAPKGLQEPSGNLRNQSIVLENKEVVPGKWRSIDFKVPEGENHYTIKLLDEGMQVYIRSMEYEI